MIMYNEEKNLLKITTPLSGVKELENSQDGVLEVLSQIWRIEGFFDVISRQSLALQSTMVFHELKLPESGK